VVEMTREKKAVRRGAAGAAKAAVATKAAGAAAAAARAVVEGIPLEVQ
jgi:hypothetical protein